MRGTRVERIAAGSTVLWGLLMLVGCFMPPDDPIGEAAYRVALAGTILSGIAWLLAKSRLAEEMVERVRQQGYTAGYGDGCDVARVRQLRAVSSDAPVPPLRVFPLTSAPQQFREEHSVGDPGDRVG